MNNSREENPFGLINEVGHLHQSVASLDSIQKEQQIITDLSLEQLEIIKAINLADFDALVNLGVAGLRLDGMTKEKLLMSKDGTHLISRSESKESLNIQYENSKRQIEEYLEQKLRGNKTLAKEERPVNINFKITDDGITPLMLACTSGNIEIVKLILANPTLIMDKRDNSGINSLYVSAYYGHFEVF